MEEVRVGTAGWSIRKEQKPLFPEGGSQLQNYSARLKAVEINSCFYRDHQDSTYQRWAQETPPDFRFAVKLSKVLTHEQELRQGAKSLTTTLQNLMSLKTKLGCILVQLPPRLEYSGLDFGAFAEALRRVYEGPVVLEPRHRSWERSDSRRLATQFQVGRVIVDSPRFSPGEAFVDSDQDSDSQGLIYFRLHGSPDLYKSDYTDERLHSYELKIRGYQAIGFRVWCIFDNTTFGHATQNALRMREFLSSQQTTRSSI